MAEIVSTLIGHLARRVRDPNSTAHPVTQVRTILSHLQRIINVNTAAITVEVSQALPPTSPSNIIEMMISLPTIARVERIQYQNEDIEPVDWEQLGNIDPYWIRATGPRPLGWSMIGRRLLTITPNPMTPNESVAIRGPKLLTALTSSSQATELPDSHMPALLAMAESLLLIRHRLMTSVKPAVEHVDRALGTANP